MCSEAKAAKPIDSTFQQDALDWLMNESTKRGTTIQRYKGSG